MRFVNESHNTLELHGCKKDTVSQLQTSNLLTKVDYLQCKFHVSIIFGLQVTRTCNKSQVNANIIP